jgi:outer membrane lipoprotein-sorting protein
VSLIVSLLLLATGAATAAPAAAPPDAATILQRSQSRWQGLTSYQVPVTISGHVRVAIISVPFRMTGTQYYQTPNEQALHLDNPPSLARGFGNTLSTMGTPQTWLRDYAISAPASQAHGHHTAYILIGTPKASSRVKSMTMSVSAKTYAIESVTFAYTNGATLVVTFKHHPGETQYHLPRLATVDARFPSYSGSATITYGSYQLNEVIPASVFQQH